LQPELLGQWLVSHVVAAFPLTARGLTLDARLGDVYVYHNAWSPDVALQWDGPNRVTVTANAAPSGTLFAVANGRWRDQPDDPPGLPGPVGGTTRTWHFTYDWSEVWLSVGTSAIVIALAVVLLWRTTRG